MATDRLTEDQARSAAARHLAVPARELKALPGEHGWLFVRPDPDLEGRHGVYVHHSGRLLTMPSHIGSVAKFERLIAEPDLFDTYSVGGADR